MTETILAIIGFVLIAILAVIEISNGMTIRRLKKVIDDLYYEVAVDRTNFYKELSHIQDSYDVVHVELGLVASRCNQCEKNGCANHVATVKEATSIKPKRPRKPKQ